MADWTFSLWSYAYDTRPYAYEMADGEEGMAWYACSYAWLYAILRVIRVWEDAIRVWMRKMKFERGFASGGTRRKGRIRVSYAYEWGHTRMAWLGGWPGSALACVWGGLTCHTRMSMVHTRMGIGRIPWSCLCAVFYCVVVLWDVGVFGPIRDRFPVILRDVNNSRVCYCSIILFSVHITWIWWWYIIECIILWLNMIYACVDVWMRLNT